jgi:hypothetical protein
MPGRKRASVHGEPGTLAPQEQDVQALLRLFLHKLDAGRPLAYATFREAWREMHFSLIYEVSTTALSA